MPARHALPCTATHASGTQRHSLPHAHPRCTHHGCPLTHPALLARGLTAPKIPPTPGTPTRVPCGAEGQGGCACSHSTKSRGSFYGSGGGARDSPAPKAAWPLSGLERKRQAGGRAREGSGSSQHRGGLGVWGQLGLLVPARMAAPSPVPWVPSAPETATAAGISLQPPRATLPAGVQGSSRCAWQARWGWLCPGKPHVLRQRCVPRCPGSTRQVLVVRGPPRPTALPARWLAGASGRAGHPDVPSTPVRAGWRKHIPACACWDLCVGTWRAREGPQSQDEPPPSPGGGSSRQQGRWAQGRG